VVERAAHSLFSRFKIRNISIIKRTCKNNNKTKHYQQRNTCDLSVFLEYFATWLGDWCPKGQMSVKLDIRTQKMGPQSFPESSDTKRLMTPCIFLEPQKTQLCSCENPKTIYWLTSLYAPYLTTLSASEVLQPTAMLFKICSTKL
jgi:hypothetical protein